MKSLRMLVPATGILAGGPIARGSHVSAEPAQGGSDRSTPELRRVLTLWPLVFYGLGIIVGAGIYVAIGAVIRSIGSGCRLKNVWPAPSARSLCKVI
jgi:hypothetical protein